MQKNCGESEAKNSVTLDAMMSRIKNVQRLA